MLKRIFMGVFMLWVTLHLTGCDFIQSLPIPFIHKDEELMEEMGEEEEAEPASEHQALIDTKPTPLISSYRPISVKMPDGLKIEGTLYIPGLSPYKAPVISEETETEGGGGADPEGEDAEKAKKPDKEATPAPVQYPLIILFHGLSGDRWEWKEYPEHLVKAGYAVLALDLRGHGDSVYQGKHLRVWRQFDRSDWEKMAADTRNVLKYIARQSKFNMVNTHKVGVVGASIGANIGLTFAHLDAKDVKATVLLSPGLEYQGIKTEEVMKHFRTPVYLLASTEDAYAADSTEQLYKEAPGRKKIKIFQDLGHGIDMLNNDSELGRDILDWMKQQLPPTGIASAEPAKKPEAPKPVKAAKVVAPVAKPQPSKPKPNAAPVKATQPAPAKPKHETVAKPVTPAPKAVTPTPKPAEARPVTAEPAKKPAPAAQPAAKPSAPATPPPAAPTPVVAPTPMAPIPGSQ